VVDAKEVTDDLPRNDLRCRARGVCTRDQPAGRRPLHVIGGEFCGAEIENGQVLCDEHGALGAGVCPCFADLLEMPASDLIQATKCGIAGPHAPGAHPPPIDLDQEDEEEPSGEGAG
jgi:hypothetical protein